MAIDVARTSVIERPIAEVAAYAGDPTNAPAWCRRVDAVDWETDPPTRLGSRVRIRTTWFGRTLESTHEIVELTPGEQVAMRTVDGPVSMRTTLTWRPVGGRVTHMVLRNQGGPSGIAVLATPFLAAAMRRTMATDLATLKGLLES